MEYRRFPQGFVVRLDLGEEIVSCLAQLTAKENIQLASVYGLGATNDAVIGVFDNSQQKYYPFHYQGDYEITALVGNITRKEGEPYIHLHITIGNALLDQVHAGHLTSAVVSATAELFVHVWDGQVGRRFDPQVALNVFKF